METTFYPSRRMWADIVDI